jgi:hypothetical protein
VGVPHCPSARFLSQKHHRCKHSQRGYAPTRRPIATVIVHPVSLYKTYKCVLQYQFYSEAADSHALRLRSKMMSPTRAVAAALCVYLNAMPLLVSAQSLTRPAIPTPLTTSLPSLVAQIPPCAIACLKSAANSVNCPPEDFTCLCKQAGSLATSLGGCILLSSCSGEDQTSTFTSRPKSKISP